MGHIETNIPTSHLQRDAARRIRTKVFDEFYRQRPLPMGHELISLLTPLLTPLLSALVPILEAILDAL